MKKIEKIFLGFIFLVSLVFHFHNITHYNPDFGFDGLDHQAYISWIATNHNLPNGYQDWEFLQTPLYYTAGAVFESVSVNPQFLNFFVFIALSIIVYRLSKSTVSTLALLSLPMANYLAPQITNEFMSGMWIVLSLFLILNIPKLIKPRDFFKQIFFSTLVIALGFYTKYTSLSLIPILILAIFLNRNISLTQKIKTIFLSGAFILLLISPILIRNNSLYGKPLVMAPDIATMGGEGAKRDFVFFTRLDWIFKADIFNARKYSFSGGLWNTLWHDGEYSTVPVVPFHKKAFSLWLLGFPLLIMSFIGLIKLLIIDKVTGLILFSYLFIALASLVQYSIYIPYDYVLKAFYTFGVIVPYALGLSEFSKFGKWHFRVILLLLVFQFCLMVSYFWIQPWWHVAK